VECLMSIHREIPVGASMCRLDNLSISGLL